MHILRWLMKHPIMLAWLLAIVAILLNFSMGSKSGEHAQEVAAGHAQEAAPVAAVEHGQASESQQPAASTEVAQQVAGGDTAQTGAATQGTQAVVAQAAAQQQAETPSANGVADLLRAAREAYWANELDSAVGFYTDLLKQSPDSLEYKGELANVYWKQGNAQQAATLFADIAPEIAAQGRVTEALNMKLYVDMVNPELAKQIDAALKK
jgi:hypothetical protein